VASVDALRAGAQAERSIHSRASPAVSVVIPTHNRRDLLLAELRALEDQTLPLASYEVIVVVDGSGDGTQQALEGLTAGLCLRHIALPGRGRAAAVNAGIRAATGEIVVLLDDDMLPARELLAGHLDAHRGGDRVGVVGAAPIHLEADAAPVTKFIGTKFNRHLDALAAGRPIGFRDLYTGNFSIRRSLLMEVGLFDEDFTIYGNEDGELGIRLLAAGVRLIYAPEAVAQQRYTKTFTALARDNEAKGRTAVLLARKHPHALSSLKLTLRPSRKLRLVRSTLLELSRRWSGTPRLVIRGFHLLERMAPAIAERSLPVALDYFYWLGARAELRRTPPLRAAQAPTRTNGE
jgi:GT2 family glycosyltransferase